MVLVTVNCFTTYSYTESFHQMWLHILFSLNTVTKKLFTKNFDKKNSKKIFFKENFFQKNFPKNFFSKSTILGPAKVPFWGQRKVPFWGQRNLAGTEIYVKDTV